MSLLQNEEFIIYNLRASYLSQIKDGVGERLITINQGVFNTPGFRAAEWSPNPADIKRTYSPPIPTAIASEYFQVPPRSAGHAPPGFGDDEEEGGMVTGGGVSGDTVGPALNTKRRRRREQLEEEDSSDLSGESDEDGEGTQRAAQQIRFAKMPVRTRSGSSPIPISSGVDDISGLKAPRRLHESRLRRGSLGAVEAMKERTRRARTDSDLSTDNDLDVSSTDLQPVDEVNDEQGTEDALNKVARQLTKESTDLEGEDSGDESDGTSLASAFAEADDTPSLLTNPLTSSPLPVVQELLAAQDISPRKTRAAPNYLPALPPPRPISKVQHVSLLTTALKAKRLKVASPFERFATLSGKGDPNPLNMKIYAPFSKSPTQPYEVAIRRVIREEKTAERKATVVDAIGLSLWRYSEENMQPAVTGDKMNVNRWMLRMVEDGEVDYDFPSLDRTKAMDDFAFNNNRAQRSRSNSKVYDEFALVEATDVQFRENEQLTPNPVTASATPEEEREHEITQPPTLHIPIQYIERPNPILGHDFSMRHQTIIPADLPFVPASHASPRKGPSKILKIHFNSHEGYPQLVALDVTTDTYLAEVLETVCKRRNLNKASYILKVSNTNVLAPLDRTVESLGEREDIDLVPQQFNKAITGSPTSHTNTPPNAPLFITTETLRPTKNHKKSTPAQILHPHPLSQTETLLATNHHHHQTAYKRWTVFRRQPMSFLPTQERTLAIDGEYLHLMPTTQTGGGGRSTFFDTTSTTKTIQFSSIVGCKCSRKHPAQFKVVVYRQRESKRYDFEAVNDVEAAEIVAEIKRGVERIMGEGVV
ncbi:MAG: hypothetical protein M1816_004346 [Peltula sp. TS41687]|nr:MAG: hypothetical protein M1816_004346 [Peltula sp. TS41687]